MNEFSSYSQIRSFKGVCDGLEIVFVGQCEVCVCLDFVHFFPLAAKLIGPQRGVSSLKNFYFSVTHTLNF